MMAVLDRFVRTANDPSSDVSPVAYRWSAGGVLVAAASVGLWKLATPSLWLDEAVSWFSSSGPWGRVAEQAMAAEDSGGFLYAPLLKLWRYVAGDSEIALRLPSVIGMLVLVAVLMHAARLMWGHRTALAVGVVTLLHPSVITAGRQARGYAFVLALTGFCLLGLAWQWLGRRTASRAMFCAASLAITALHVFGVFVAAGTALASVALAWDARRTARGLRDAAKALDPHVPSDRPLPLEAARALLPFLPAFLLAIAWRLVLSSTVESRLELFWVKGTLVHNTAVVFVTAFAPILAGAAAVGAAERGRGRRLATGLLLVASPILLGPIVLSAAVHTQHNFVILRYVLPLVPLGTLSCGYLLSKVKPVVATLVIVIAAVASLAYAASKHEFASATRTGQETRSAAAFLRSAVRPGDDVRVVPSWEWFSFAYYEVPYLTALPNTARGYLGEPARPPVAGSSTWTVFFNGRPDATVADREARSFGTMTIVRAPRIVP